MKIGSLCSGYGGLDMAVEAFYEAETMWMADIDKASSKVIEQRWKLPNLGDLKKINWEEVEKVDILTAGYPCQPFSQAGQRKGANDERHLWPTIKEIISTIRPSVVILENVRGHLTLGFKEVLQGLTEIGYDARWEIIRASDVGAPHRRERLFIIAYPNSSTSEQLRRTGREVYGERSQVINGSDRQEFGTSCSTVTDSNDSRRLGNTERPSSGYQSSVISNTDSEQLQTDGQTPGLGWRFETPLELSMRRTPNPLDQSKLNPRFVEYMMGLPEGWVTDLDISRAQQFKLLGNGVVPQQAFRALEILNTI